jgi:drug/metabolite transporter (DMT)-like permease
MAAKHFFQLVLLAAMWGSSFMFMRIAVPALGPGWMLEIRLLSSALFLFAVTRFIREPLHSRRHWKHYLVLGVFNTAVPFFAFAWASQALPASILAIINSTAPLWAVIVGVVWYRKPITARALLGLGCGAGGVAMIVGMGTLGIKADALVYVGVAMIASVCYAIASSYAESAKSVPPFANAHGSLWAAFILVTPFMPLSPLPVEWTQSAIAATLTMGVVCSGLAYLLYYHLLSVIGAPSAMTVGYLIPLWGVFWGWLFLDEAIGWHTLGGAALVLIGTALVTGLRIDSLLRRLARSGNDS